MVWPENLLGDGKSALIEWFRLVILALPNTDEGEIIEACGDVRMLRAKGAFADGEGALVERFCVSIPTLRLIEFGEVS